LISVHDKTGLVAFARRLVDAGWEIVSSGGTGAALGAAGVEVTQVEEVTGAPEMLGGRVKTLHPSIHAGILSRGPEDRGELEQHGIEPFDLVVCNLYPFRETVARDASTEADIVENIDIGGPAMIRAAAKNHHRVAIVVTPDRYDQVAAAIETGTLDDATRRELASEAFAHTAAYDSAIADWIGVDRSIFLHHVARLRYGENPHQEADLYREDGAEPWWSAMTQHQGKAMSFNNYADADAAWRLASALGPGSVVVVKHTNPAGAARGGVSVAETFERAWEGDSLAAFGGVIGVNAELDAETAALLADRFVEVAVARSVTSEAKDALSGKKGLRLITAPPVGDEGLDFRRITGGFLVQTPDHIETDGWETVSKRPATGAEMDSLALAWLVAAHTKSNAVVIADGSKVVGVGAGDQSRVGAAQRAVARAGDRAKGAVAASDAFFPFRDGLDTLAEAGITAMVEPGGSIRDDEVIAAADEQGLALVFTGRRHFRH
jgi:phosphoribosylaminoimidazolecarboxamide formyltransferase/IMP cyclohydrolase